MYLSKILGPFLLVLLQALLFVFTYTLTVCLCALSAPCDVRLMLALDPLAAREFTVTAPQTLGDVIKEAFCVL